ncbi:MAG: glycosyltransferase, partial [Chloroflexota bacterium]
MKCVIFLPALNEAETIQNVISNLPGKLEGIESILVLVVDDGSTDQTAALAVSAGAYVISHHRNRGVGSAFHSAIEFALENNADVLVGFDAD